MWILFMANDPNNTQIHNNNNIDERNNYKQICDYIELEFESC